MPILDANTSSAWTCPPLNPAPSLRPQPQTRSAAGQGLIACACSAMALRKSPSTRGGSTNCLRNTISSGSSTARNAACTLAEASRKRTKAPSPNGRHQPWEPSASCSKIMGCGPNQANAGRCSTLLHAWRISRHAACKSRPKSRGCREGVDMSIFMGQRSLADRKRMRRKKPAMVTHRYLTCRPGNDERSGRKRRRAAAPTPAIQCGWSLTGRARRR